MLKVERKFSFLLFLRAFIVFCLVASRSFAHAEYIQELNAALNSTVTIKCEEIDVTRIYFLVNNTPAAEDKIIKRGFAQESQHTVNGSVEISLSVWAQEINNNTNISCFTVPGDNRSTTVILKIQGLLASVGGLRGTVINGSSVLLSWTPPYTLDNVPITGYYIDDGSRNYTTNDTSFVLSSTDPDPCNLTNVSVSAINAVGRGEPAYISFYYERVPLVTPTVSVIPLVNKMNRSFSLNITINVSELCIGEYPNNVTFCVLETDGTVMYSNSVAPEINDQLMIMTGYSPLTLPDTPTVFIVNVSLSNKGGEFNDVLSLGIPEPVTDIRLINDSCTTITVAWNSPKCTYILCEILYYKLNINDAPLIASNTSYEFEDKNVNHHKYNISVTAVNVLGQGIPSNATCFYQKVPRPALENTTSLNVSNDTVQYNIPVSVVCIGEAPENATITLLCNETGFVNSSVKYITGPVPGNITGLFPLPQNQKCHLTIIFSNGAGNSEPLILTISPNVLPSNVPIDKIPLWKRWKVILAAAAVGIVIFGGVASFFIIVYYCVKTGLI